MTDPDRDRWNAARSVVVARWRQILEQIEARDEGGALALTTEMDEFCDEAIAERTKTNLAASDAQKPPPSGQAAESQPTQMCHFCRGFIQYGGCAGITQEVNHAILGGEWDQARARAEEWIDTLQGMDFSAA